MEKTIVERDVRRTTSAYVVAVAAPALAVLIRLPFDAILEMKVPYITFFLATAVSASFGGLGPGILSTALGALFATYFFLDPRASVVPRNLGDALGIFLFVTISGFISYLCERLIETRKHENAVRVLFEQTLISMSDGLISVDTAQRVRLMNPVAEQLTGWTQAEAKNHNIGEVLRIVNEGTDEPAANPFEPILKERLPVYSSTHTELITKSGERIAIEKSGSPIRATSGALAGAVLVFRDVRDKRQAERALVRANENLQQFAFAASHDLREPLRVVTIFSQLLQMKYEAHLDASAKEYIGQVIRAGERMTRLIDGLLEFTFVGDMSKAQQRTADASQALDHALENLQISIAESMAQITHGPLPTVAADPRHVSLLFQNLIANAIKYRRPGITPKVHISAQADSASWVFAVEDNGIGIAEEDRQKIFEPFKRLHGGEIAGAGIGLATCQRLIEGYNGRIWVEPSREQGSVFYFTMPGH